MRRSGARRHVSTTKAYAPERSALRFQLLKSHHRRYGSCERLVAHRHRRCRRNRRRYNIVKRVPPDYIVITASNVAAVTVMPKKWKLEWIKIVNISSTPVRLLVLIYIKLLYTIAAFYYNCRKCSNLGRRERCVFFFFFWWSVCIVIIWLNINVSGGICSTSGTGKRRHLRRDSCGRRLDRTTCTKYLPRMVPNKSVNTHFLLFNIFFSTWHYRFTAGPGYSIIKILLYTITYLFVLRLRRSAKSVI